MKTSGESFGQAYFDRFYHQPKTRVHSRAHQVRSFRAILHGAEFILRGTPRRVTEVGAGTGWLRDRWMKARPHTRYIATDVSQYAVTTYGLSRVLSVTATKVPGVLHAQDLVICRDVLAHLPIESLDQAARNLMQMTGKMLFLEMATAEDLPYLTEQSDRTLHFHPKAQVEEILRDHGLKKLGLGFWSSDTWEPDLFALTQQDS